MKRATRAEWSKRVERWRASGLSAAEFGRRAGVSDKSLRWWKWQLAQAPAAEKARPASSAMTFVEMTSTLRRDPIEIVLVSGERILLPADFDGDAFARAVDVLRRQR